MKTINEDEIREVVDACWRVANDAKLDGKPMDYGENVQGHPQHNTIRLNLFYHLLGALLPKTEMTVRTQLTEPKEPWQRGDEDEE